MLRKILITALAVGISLPAFSGQLDTGDISIQTTENISSQLEKIFTAISTIHKERICYWEDKAYSPGSFKNSDGIIYRCTLDGLDEVKWSAEFHHSALQNAAINQ